MSEDLKKDVMIAAYRANKQRLIKTIGRITCPICNGNRVDRYGFTDFDLSPIQNKGWATAHCKCLDCNFDFTTRIEFNYEITKCEKLWR